MPGEAVAIDTAMPGPDTVQAGLLDAKADVVEFFGGDARPDRLKAGKARLHHVGDPAMEESTLSKGKESTSSPNLPPIEAPSDMAAQRSAAQRESNASWDAKKIERVAGPEEAPAAPPPPLMASCSKKVDTLKASLLDTTGYIKEFFGGDGRAEHLQAGKERLRHIEDPLLNKPRLATTFNVDHRADRADFPRDELTSNDTSTAASTRNEWLGDWSTGKWQITDEDRQRGRADESVHRFFASAELPRELYKKSCNLKHVNEIKGERIEGLGTVVNNSAEQDRDVVGRSHSKEHGHKHREHHHHEHRKHHHHEHDHKHREHHREHHHHEHREHDRKANGVLIDENGGKVDVKVGSHGSPKTSAQLEKLADKAKVGVEDAAEKLRETVEGHGHHQHRHHHAIEKRVEEGRHGEVKDLKMTGSGERRQQKLH